MQEGRNCDSCRYWQVCAEKPWEGTCSLNGKKKYATQMPNCLGWKERRDKVNNGSNVAGKV